MVQNSTENLLKNELNSSTKVIKELIDMTTINSVESNDLLNHTHLNDKNYSKEIKNITQSREIKTYI
ncbi:hypothetical protein [Clostridium sp. 'White wine YQ']|uniref:hypothetical protein n=1 Tax=Clostridium sp. 'White wine YQ' TaxID=3027474 RepID=UPI0023661D26|nr:hypothetical protein [Clostridium sp. 'White wine YQ']MDD7794161.1 hypothetical protein [Clostridium sp. 'White wine YQ']